MITDVVKPKKMVYISFDGSDDIYQSTKSLLEGTYDTIENFMICAGILAEYYEKIGGKVIYYGKPHNNIYEFCYKLIKGENKILVIGDSLENDIKGANLQKLDSLLITDGIHREVNNESGVDIKKLDDLMEKKKLTQNISWKVYYFELK